MCCNSYGFSDDAMVCEVKKSGIEKCAPYLTLHSADLAIYGKGRFVLKRDHTACCHGEDIAIRGRVEPSHFEISLSLELLATEIQ